MAFKTSVALDGCRYTYAISPAIKKFTLRDVTFAPLANGNFEFKRLLEVAPNSGDGFLMKITVNPELTGFKLSILDRFGTRNVNIFNGKADPIIVEKFYFQMQLFVDRDVFTQTQK
ncbi:MAG: DUF1831 domain-containing protein [Streptococcaceae bacterium]|jgi:hypothetical protein|nr:DUF1831 domain-containing protein [Streptococcaceae bacterium]